MENLANLEEYLKGLQIITDSNDPNKKLYTDGENVFYTMFNMGSYIGHRTREFGDEAPDAWFLMNYRINHLDGHCEYGEALVDDAGRYLRVDISVDDVRRIIDLNGDYVITDLIHIDDNTKDSRFSQTSYYALDSSIYSEGKVPTGEYFSREHEFKNKEGSVYQGLVPGDNLFIKFSNTNNVLKSMVEGRKLR